MSGLTLEIKDQRDRTRRVGPAVVTPDIDEDYWVYRVRLSDTRYTVMVKWAGRKRAERLATGTTTTRKVHASLFHSREDATRAAREAFTGIAGVERWWIAPF